MFTVELSGKKYRIDKVTAKTLRDIGAAQEVFRRWTKDPEGVDMKKDMDSLVGWFCTLCGGQFTPDEVYDNYPADRIITDIGLALAAVNAQATEVLKEFPTSDSSKKKAPSPTLYSRFTGFMSKKAARRTK
ncbi:MAG: phage tail assembly chaperone G [Christensenellales bacterium]